MLMDRVKPTFIVRVRPMLLVRVRPLFMIKVRRGPLTSVNGQSFQIYMKGHIFLFEDYFINGMLKH